MSNSEFRGVSVMVFSVDSALANQIVNTIGDVCEKNVNIISPGGIILASTDSSRVGTFHEIGHLVAQQKSAIEVQDDSTYAGTHRGINMPIYYNGRIIAVVGITGNPNEVRKYAYLADRITHLLIREREVSQYSRIQSEKKHFIIQSLLSNEAYDPDYMRECFSDFHMDASTSKRLIIVQVNSRYNVTNLSMLEPQVSSLFESLSPSVMSYNYPRQYIAIIEGKTGQKHMKIVKDFADAHAPFLRVAVGKETSFAMLRESYHSALTALNAPDVSDESFVMYDSLLLEVILANIPASDREDFCLKTIASLEPEELELLETYFKESCSLEKTAKTLYHHKNAFQYRLNKIWKKTGLNPRDFKDAVNLYLALALNRR